MLRKCPWFERRQQIASGACHSTSYRFQLLPACAKTALTPVNPGAPRSLLGIDGVAPLLQWRQWSFPIIGQVNRPRILADSAILFPFGRFSAPPCVPSRHAGSCSANKSEGSLGVPHSARFVRARKDRCCREKRVRRFARRVPPSSRYAGLLTVDTVGGCMQSSHGHRPDTTSPRQHAVAE
jgi:hypothetical protein